MIATHSASLTRSTIASAEKPPKTTECAAPMRAHASIATGKFGDHRQINRDAVAFLHAQLAQAVGKAADVVQATAIGDRPAVAGLAFEVICDPVAQAGLDVAVEAIDGNVEFAVGEPLRKRLVPLQDFFVRLDPFEFVGPRRPEGFIVAVGLLVDSGLCVGLSGKLRIRRKQPILLLQRLNGLRLDNIHFSDFPH